MPSRRQGSQLRRVSIAFTLEIRRYCPKVYRAALLCTDSFSWWNQLYMGPTRSGYIPKLDVHNTGMLILLPWDVGSTANVVYVFIPTKVICNVDPEVLNIIHMFKMVTMYVIGISNRICCGDGHCYGWRVDTMGQYMPAPSTRVSRHKHDDGEWPVDLYKLTRRLSRRF